MVKEFFQRLSYVLLVLVLILLTTINLWQNDRIEAKQIQILSQLERMERKVGAGRMLAAAIPQSTQSSSSLSSEPGNLLTKDPDSYLPNNAQPGGKLLMKLSSDPKGLNFLIENGADVSQIENYMTINLINRHQNNVKKHGPGLATYLGRSDDYLTYSYKIRQDIFWHEPVVDNSDKSFDWLYNGKTCRKGHFNNGRCRVTAHDVIFWLKMVKNNQVAGAAPIRSYFKDLASFKATDDFSFEITFSKKSFKNNLISKSLTALPEFLYAYDTDGTRFDEEIIGSKIQEHWYNPKGLGNGPYRFVRYTPGELIELERDPLYPLEGNTFDKIILQVVKDENQPPRMLQNKTLHIATMSRPQYRKNYLEAPADSAFRNGSLKRGEFESYGYSYIGWNSDIIYFKDKRVRRAMSHAFHADRILKDVYLNLGQRTSGPITPFLPQYDKSLKPLAFDLEKAGKLLDEAGWKDSDGDGIRDKMIDGEKRDFDFTFTIISGAATHKTMGDIFKEDLAKIGVKMSLRPLEWANLLKQLDSKEFHAVTLGWATGPDVDFYQIWHSSQADIPKGSNRVGFRSKEADKIIEALELEFDPAKRTQLCHAFHKITYEEQPYTFLFAMKTPYFYQPELKNAKTAQTRPYFNPRPWFFNSK